MTYRLSHRTVYDYPEPVTVSHHAARLEPRMTATQRLEEFSIQIEPEPGIRRMRTDYFGNHVCFFTIQEIHQHLEIHTASLVTVTPPTRPNLAGSPPWERVVELF